MAVYLLVAVVVVAVVSGRQDLSSYNDHPCARECEEGAAPMTCVYNFTLESYFTLSKACYNCPYNHTDCFRPHCISTDGISRPIMTVNRMIPGPTIQVCQNDMVVVNVHNMLEGADGVSIHWHGVFQKGYQYHDGTDMITQCPITPGSLFQYKFKASNRGTHYWHSHSGFQRGDGINGAFIVREPRSRDPSSSLYQHDLPEHILQVQDWFHDQSNALFTGHYHAGVSDKPPSLLINGRGAFKPFTDPSTNQVVYTPYSVFRVQKGQTYRFKAISNGITKCPIMLSIDGHEILMIASDGVPFEEITVSSFNINAGERFDFVLDANNDIGNYWIRAREHPNCTKTFASQVAILRYENAGENEPSAPTDFASGNRDGKLLNPLNTKGTPDLIPVSWLNVSQTDLPDPGMKDVPDKQFFLVMDVYPHNDNGIQNKDFYPVGAVKSANSPQINRISSQLPPSPLLSQYKDVPKDMFCGPQHTMDYCSKEYCGCINVLKIDLDDTVEMVVMDEGRGFRHHPVHLHGHNFRVVAIDRVNETITKEEFESLDAQGLIERKLDAPIAKDTVTVPDGGYTIIRFKADNPGFWLLHCHVLFHHKLGMAVVLQVGEVEQMPRPPKHFPRCGGWVFTEDEEEKPTPKPCAISGAESFQMLGLTAVIYISVAIKLL